MKSKLKQIYYDMRHQPVIAWVTFLATAMSVFLIMVVIMMQRVKTVPFPPESCRDRLLVGLFLHVEADNEAKSGGLSYHSAKVLYDGLDGVEHTSYFHYSLGTAEVMSTSGDTFLADERKTDAAFFDIFDHKLIEGRFYTPEEADALLPLAVITESLAQNTLGDAPWCGKNIIINHQSYTVIGVIRDNSTLAMTAHADLFTPTGSADTEGEWNPYMGKFGVALLVADGVDFQHVRDQVKGRYSVIDSELADQGFHTVYHEAPFSQEIIGGEHPGSNVTPSASGKRMRLTVYIILLLVPAINLSSMLHSRMRKRINEMGIRRAFGCTRLRIMTDIITENFLITLAGGIVGVILGIIFAAMYSGLYVNTSNFGRADTPALSAFLNWGTIGIAILICFILNILSASLPAWQASRVNPVEALNSK